MRTPIYMLEKYTGLRDENGVELYYVFALRLTRSSAIKGFEDEIANGTVRIRKLVATK